jgi:hypothetical protein
MAAGRFEIDDVHAQPDFLWELGVWEYVVRTPSGFGWVQLSAGAREQLGAGDRAWIVKHLNGLAVKSSFNVTCANLLTRLVVPDPPTA